MSNLALTPSELTTDQLNLIKTTVAKNATNDELKLFLYRCQNMGLDPLKPGHIHFVKYGNNPGTIIIGIDGFRSRAAKTGKHTGTKRGIIRGNDGKCLGAWAEVFRADWSHPAREEVSLSEYNTQKSNWLKMPETMIKKVAEVAALRMAFPDELGGVYSDDEMANVPSTGVEIAESVPVIKEARQLPPETSASDDPSEFAATFGKYKGIPLHSLDIYELADYVAYIEKKADEDKKPIRGQVADFLNKAKQFLESRAPETPAALDVDEELPF